MKRKRDEEGNSSQPPAKKAAVGVSKAQQNIETNKLIIEMQAKKARESSMEVEWERNPGYPEFEIDLLNADALIHQSIRDAYQKVTILNIGTKNVTSETFADVINALNPSLEVLIIKNEDYKLDIAKEQASYLTLAAFLYNSKLKELHIDGKFEGGIILTLNALENSKTLTHFSVTHGVIEDVSKKLFASSITRFLTDAKQLTHLSFINTGLDTIKITAVAEALRYNKKITTITLSEITPKPDGVQAIIKMLEVNKWIRKLDLSNNSISTINFQTICNMLKDKPIMRLNMSDWNVSRSILGDLKALSGLIDMNRNIVHMDYTPPTKNERGEYTYHSTVGYKKYTKPECIDQMISNINTKCATNENAIKTSVTSLSSHGGTIKELFEYIHKAKFINDDAYKQIRTALHTLRYRALGCVLNKSGDMGPLLGRVPFELCVMIMSFVPEGTVQLNVASQSK